MKLNKTQQEKGDEWRRTSNSWYAHLTNWFNNHSGLNKIQERLKIKPFNERTWAKSFDTFLGLLPYKYSKWTNAANDVINIYNNGRPHPRFKTSAGDLDYIYTLGKYTYEKFLYFLSVLF